jgi:hypothetical protein
MSDVAGCRAMEMTLQVAALWRYCVANARKLTPNTAGSGSEKQTGGANSHIIRLLGDSRREMFSSRCTQARWLLGQTLSTAILVPNNKGSSRTR